MSANHGRAARWVADHENVGDAIVNIRATERMVRRELERVGERDKPEQSDVPFECGRFDEDGARMRAGGAVD